MPIDVLDKVLPLLEFDSDDCYYYLQILQRRKDNPDIVKNTVTIKDYYIRNKQYLLDRYPEIKKLCEFFNARASLRLNKRSFRKTALRTMQNITAHLMQDDYASAKQAYSKAAGQCHDDKNKKWLLDLDTEDMNGIDLDYGARQLAKVIAELSPVGDKMILELPTKNGLHLITRPFNLQELPNVGFTFDIHKDNPINLYIPG